MSCKKFRDRVETYIAVKGLLFEKKNVNHAPFKVISVLYVECFMRRILEGS